MYCTILLVNGNLTHTEINSNDRKHLALEYVQVLQARRLYQGTDEEQILHIDQSS